jgi:hypothetical protein
VVFVVEKVLDGIACAAAADKQTPPLATLPHTPPCHCDHQAAMRSGSAARPERRAPHSFMRLATCYRAGRDSYCKLPSDRKEHVPRCCTANFCGPLRSSWRSPPPLPHTRLLSAIPASPRTTAVQMCSATRGPSALSALSLCSESQRLALALRPFLVRSWSGDSHGLPHPPV